MEKEVNGEWIDLAQVCEHDTENILTEELLFSG